MIIDSHFHFDLKGFNSSGSIKKYLMNNNIDKIILLTWEECNPVIPSLYKHLSIENIWHIYQELPEQIIPFYAPDPTKTDALEKFKYWYRKGIKGFGELKVAIKWDDPRLTHILNYLNKESLPLLFHMQGPQVFRVPRSNEKTVIILSKYTSDTKWRGIPSSILSCLSRLSNRLRELIEKSTLQIQHPGYMMDFKELEPVLNKYPNIKFIGHGPYFWEMLFENDIDPNSERRSYKIKQGRTYSLLEKYENLFADLSGPSGFSIFTKYKSTQVEDTLEKFNSKILFGTDNYNYNLLDLLKRLNISEKAKRNILGLNTNKIIK